MKNERLFGFVMIGVSYVVAFSLAFVLYFVLCGMALNSFLALFLADVLATVVVYVFGLIYKNSSFYDPYWSITPLVFVVLYICHKQCFNFTNLLFLLVFGFWAIRLTVNWATTFHSVSKEDWRYEMYRENNSKAMWHFLNFTGINMMPTLFVFAGMLPALFMIEKNAEFNAFAVVGAAVILFGTLLELFADIDMHTHLKSEESKKVCRVGLWKYSRHPNYLGEITVWFGVYFMQLAVDTERFYTFFGAVAILCLFVFVSIPMMEKRQRTRRADYADYVKETSMLLLWKNKTSNGEQTESDCQRD